MLRRLLVSASIVAAAAAVPGGASAAGGSAREPPVLGKLPIVTRVSPHNLSVGELLTVTGRNFRPGKLQNQVVFSRLGAQPVFALAESSSTRVMRLHLPAKLLTALPRQSGKPVPARFRITVMSDRYQPKLLPSARSPLIAAPPASAHVPGAADCDGDGLAETAQIGVVGLLVVGLHLPGVKALDPQQVGTSTDPTGTPSQPSVPNVPGVPGAPNVPVPTGLPPESLPPATAPVSCAPAAAAQ